MLANWITLSRFPLLPAALLMLTFGGAGIRFAGVALLFLGLFLDTVDGLVARSRGQTSLFGSVLDIAADRAYELVLWLWLAHLGFIPVVIPLLVIVRTTLTDAFRSIGIDRGIAPFLQHRTRLGRFLVGHTVMRTGYSISKTLTFCGFALVQALRSHPADSLAAAFVVPLRGLLGLTAWIAVGLCVLRGLPVVVHSMKHEWGRPGAGTLVAGGQDR